jgi:hypothetical protein
MLNNIEKKAKFITISTVIQNSLCRTFAVYEFPFNQIHNQFNWQRNLQSMMMDFDEST